jgi:hypothetical protein
LYRRLEPSMGGDRDRTSLQVGTRARLR